MKWFAAGCLALLANAGMADDRGRQLAAACAGCHNAEIRNSAIPAIAGMDAGRLTEMMLAYRSGARVNQIMQVVAGNLSEDEIAAVARYISAQPTGASKP